MIRPLKLIVLGLTLSGLAACSAATQNIPVSSNPTGAIVYSDGTEVCTTPCNVKLEKTQAHILTIKKEGYKQADIQISRKYDTAGVTRDSVETGMRQSSWGADTEGAIANALLTAGAKEEDGSAYTLSPSSVVVDLVALGQAGNSGLAKPAEQQKAKVKTTETPTLTSEIENDGAKTAETVLENAAVAAPTVGTKKEWGSSHSSTHMNSDGSMTKTTSSSSTSVGVKVNPVEAGLDVLHFLEGEGEKKEDTPSE